MNWKLFHFLEIIQYKSRDHLMIILINKAGKELSIDTTHISLIYLIDITRHLIAIYHMLLVPRFSYSISI